MSTNTFLIGNIKGPPGIQGVPGPAGTGLNSDMVRNVGRNLFAVLGVGSIAEAMAEIRRRCNNNREIDNTGIPDFSGLAIGDYIDGLDLSAITAAPGGTAPAAWNDTYKNNRIVLAGLNTYKNVGDMQDILVTQNHVLFAFQDAVFTGYINSTNTNTNGYPASAMRAYLEGADGNGSGAFALGLKAALGDYLLTIRKFISQKGVNAWVRFTVFLPTELEVFGVQVIGDEIDTNGTRSAFTQQIPLFRNSYEMKVKFLNGVRIAQWLSTPSNAYTTIFTCASNYGYASGFNASQVIGCAPVFCVR